jgi:hypothetical protein
LVAFLKERRLPLIDQKANVEEIVTAMTHFEHSRLLYVVDNNEKLTGTISGGYWPDMSFLQARVIANLTIVDLLQFLIKSRKH